MSILQKIANYLFLMSDLQTIGISIFLMVIALWLLNKKADKHISKINN